MGVKKGKYRGIPIYYDPISHEMMGRNWLSDVLLNINLWFDINVIKVDSFDIWLEEDKDRDENLWI